MYREGRAARMECVSNAHDDARRVAQLRRVSRAARAADGVRDRLRRAAPGTGRLVWRPAGFGLDVQQGMHVRHKAVQRRAAVPACRAVMYRAIIHRLYSTNGRNHNMMLTECLLLVVHGRSCS